MANGNNPTFNDEDYRLVDQRDKSMFNFKATWAELREKISKYVQSYDKSLPLQDYFFSSSANYMKKITQTNHFWDLVDVFFK